MTMKGSPITQAEITELFGDTIPLSAVQLITDMPPAMTTDEVRHRLQTIKAAIPSHGASLLLSLHRRYLQALREGNQDTQDRLLNLIHEFGWAFPDDAAELKKVFSGPRPDR
ncbi:MAG: hypothetical protein AAFW74_12795 [Pseudomonadota bacterium]